MVEVKEYLTTGAATEGQLLTERKIYDTLVEAVQKKIVMRPLAAIYIGPGGIPGSSIDVDLATPDSMVVYRVAEGAPVPIATAAYTSTNLKPVKYGVRPVITREMMEDGKWDLMTHNIKVAGNELAENEEALILAVLDGATNVVSGSTAITIANITRGMQYLEDSDYTPTDLFVGAEVANDLRNIDTFVEANKFGSNEVLRTGFLGTIYGMTVHRFSSNIGTATRAYIIDRDNAFVIAEKRPVSVERYDDQTHDLSGAVCTQRIKVGLLRDYAVARITTT